MANPFDQFDEPSMQGNPFDQFDEEETPKAGIGTAVKSSFANVGNMADTALSTLAGSAAALFGDDAEALRIADEMESRRQSRNQWANPENQELTTTGKVVGTLATLPMQMVGMGFSPAETTHTALESGETNEAAIKAGLVDAAGNAIGVALPGWKAGGALVRGATGAAANVAQELATKKAIQSMMETERGKQVFAPNIDDALVSGIVGAGMGVGMGTKPSATKLTGNKKLDSIRTEAAAKPVAPETPKAPMMEPEQLRLFDQFDERSPISPYQTEMAPDMWRVDENGIPIRADLSMEVQNLQQPLQRNLFGDELDVNFPRDPNQPLGPLEGGDIKGIERFSDPVQFRNDPEGQIPLTEAIDSMDPVARTAALDQTQVGRELPASPALEVAKMDAETVMRSVMEASGDNLKGFNAKMRKQKGTLLVGGKKVDVVPTEDGFVATMDGQEVGYLRSNITPEQRTMLGEDASVDMVKVNPELRGQGVGKALYDAWTKANEGNVIPSGKTSKEAWTTWKKNNTPAVDKFVNQEAQRILGGADPQMVVGNITDPAVAQRVQARAALLKKQGGAVDPDVFLKDFPEFVGSKFKDASGKLKAFYHGTSKDKAFTDIKAGKTGAWFTDDPKGASDYAKENDSKNLKYDPDTRRYVEVNNNPHVHQVYLNAQNPYVMDAVDNAGYARADNYTKFQRELTEKAKRLGHDSIDWGGGVVTVFEPTQIKNAISPVNKKPVPFNFKKQGGGFKIDWSDETTNMENSLVRSEDGSFIPKNPEVADVLTKALSEGKDGKLWTYMQSGATSAAMKTGSAAIKAASEIVQNSLKRADLAIRNSVFPAEASLRKLKGMEIEELSTLFKDEMFNGERYDGDILAKHLTVEQLEAYRNMRDLFDRTLDVQNEARLAKGQEPISPREAYLSSRWQGDFRRPIYDADGKLVWYLAANSRMGLESQTKALIKQFPDLVVDTSKDKVVRSSTSKTDLQSAYSTMLDILGRDDPAVDKLRQAIQDQVVSESELTLAQKKHFEKKGNIRGFVGDRPGFTGSKEATAMFQQQIQYAKNAFKWAEMQTAGDSIKELISSPELQKQQPNNVKYIREYYKNAVGMGESAVFKAIDDSIRTGLGISPSEVSRVVGNIKSVFIMQKLAASAGYTAANMVQTTNVLPYLMNLRGQGYKGNPAVAIAVGVPAGLAMGVSHYMKALGGEYLSALPNQFMKDAFQYAEDNGVTARSVYDEAPLTTNNKMFDAAASTARFTMAFPETVVRSTAFMTYAQMLKDSGKFTDQSKLFQMAEELVNKSMVDYRESERALLFSKAGTTGNFLNTLQTYPISFYNQWAYMAGEAVKGRPAGLATMMALQYAIAGAMGLPGFDDADKLYRWMRDEFVSTSTWNKMAKSPFFSDPKLWMMENFGDATVYGALSDQTGIGMTSRVASPGMGAMLQSPAGPVMDLGKQAINLGKAALDPTNPTKWAQSAMSSVPVGLQGLLETAPFMKDHTYVERPDGTKVFMKTSDLADRKGGYARTPEEVDVRKWGVRSQAEVKARDVGYATSSANMSLTRRGGELIDQYYDAARNGNVKRATELATLYKDITDRDISSTQTDNQMKEEFYTEIERNADKSNTPRQLLNAARMSKILQRSESVQ